MTKINVQEYGAKGDGKTKNTLFLQKAVDTCNRNGGGTVYFPPGKYLSGTIHLKSHVTLYLESGTTLLGSTQKEDYELNSNYRPSFLGSGYFLTGTNLDNITIEGKGTIDGQGPSFWTAEMFNAIVFRPKEFRPRALIYLVDCRNIRIRDVTIINSPCFTLWFLGCERVNVNGITIINPRKGPNTDGIDVDCSQNVHISDCHIDAGDDCIALKSDAKRLGRKYPCKNVTVTNCTLRSTGCGIRVGYEGDAPIENCVFSNLVIYDTDIGIDILSILPAGLPTGVNITEGARIRNIIFSNVVMEDVNRAIYFWLGKEVPGKFSGRIEDIFLNNIIATAQNGSYIGGLPENPIRNVNMNNIKIKISGKMPKKNTAGRPGVWGFEKQPYAFYFQNIEGLKLHDSQVEWENVIGEWENTLRFENVTNLEVAGFQERHHRYKKTGATICLFKVKHAFIHSCIVTPGTDTFLELRGKSNRKTIVTNNNLGEVKRPFNLGRKKSVYGRVDNLCIEAD